MDTKDVQNLVSKDMCIICQKLSNEKVTSTDNGRNQIKQAAALRRDIVYCRIYALAEDGNRTFL